MNGIDGELGDILDERRGGEWAMEDEKRREGSWRGDFEGAPTSRLLTCGTDQLAHC
jgi:hypothetical protein